MKIRSLTDPSFLLDPHHRWPLFCNGMRENEPGSVCSLGGELMVGSYTNNSSNARSAGSNAHRTFRSEHGGIMSVWRDSGRVCAPGRK